MATTTVLVCDKGNNMCKGDVVSWRLWTDGSDVSTRVDLCGVHARPLVELAAVGVPDGLPSKQRATMEVTALRPSKATAHLKRS